MKTSDLKEGTFYQIHQPRQGGCDMPSLCGRFLRVVQGRPGPNKLEFELADSIHSRNWKAQIKLHNRKLYVSPAAVVGEWEPFAERMARVMSFRASTKLLGCIREPSVVTRAERLGVSCVQTDGAMIEVTVDNMAALLDMAERKVRKC